MACDQHERWQQQQLSWWLLECGGAERQGWFDKDLTALRECCSSGMLEMEKTEEEELYSDKLHQPV